VQTRKRLVLSIALCLVVWLLPATAWATDSIEGYAHRMAGSLPQMVETIVKFGHSAYNYFH